MNGLMSYNRGSRSLPPWTIRKPSKKALLTGTRERILTRMQPCLSFDLRLPILQNCDKLVSVVYKLPSLRQFSVAVQLLVNVSLSVMSDILLSHGLQPARLLCPWNSPGQNTRVGSCSLLQGIFPTQGSNLDPLHCRQILYCLYHQGGPSSLVKGSCISE